MNLMIFKATNAIPPHVTTCCQFAANQVLRLPSSVFSDASILAISAFASVTASAYSLDASADMLMYGGAVAAVATGAAGSR